LLADVDEDGGDDLLAIGYWLLAIGYWLLAIGYWLLVRIRSKHQREWAAAPKARLGEND